MTEQNVKYPPHKVGFITPPAWFDISPTEFLSIAPANTLVMQTTMRPPKFNYSVEQIAAAVPELLLCARSLAAADADVVAQLGYPFSLVHGWQGAQAVQQQIQDSVGKPFVMMGVEMVHALRHLGCGSVAVASTYYSHHMETVLSTYLVEAGVNVARCANWQSQGMVEESDTGVFVGTGELDPMGWETPAWAVEKAVRLVSQSSPEADFILVTGGGMRLLHLAGKLEAETGKTIVAGDLAPYWGILRRLGIRQGVTGHGKLLTSLP
ncbi:MAG: hypothetical protein JW846_04830 [Dehalococcoidia bacterium]|nr:hypothetical protein [Dehalococcoidia bacterium]